MNKTVFKQVINASKQQVWEVLFTQYGEIHIHNPTMQSSNYLDGASKAELNCVRHCQFTDKLYLDEQITKIEDGHSLAINVTEHNLPFVKHMSATYELKTLSENQTQLIMTSYNSFSPKFMKYLMAGQMKKSLLQHLFGMKYFIETGKAVDKHNYSEVYKMHGGD